MHTKTMVVNLQATNSMMTFMPGRKVPSNIYVSLYLHLWKGNHNLALLFPDSVFCSSPFPQPMVQKSSLQNRCENQGANTKNIFWSFQSHVLINTQQFHCIISHNLLLGTSSGEMIIRRKITRARPGEKRLKRVKLSKYSNKKEQAFV